MSESNEIVRSQQSPIAEWGLEKLAEFVREAGAEVGVLEAAYFRLEAKILRMHYEMGWALVIIRDQVFGKGKRKNWVQFRKANKFDGTTFDDDIRLYLLAESWDEISAKGLTEARNFLGVTKPKVRKSAAPEVTAFKDEGLELGSCGSQRGTSPLAIESEAFVAQMATPSIGRELTPKSAQGHVTGRAQTPQETLFTIVRRLEELERELEGREVARLLPLIDQAVQALERLRAGGRPTEGA